jgi:hypothetical protein
VDVVAVSIGLVLAVPAQAKPRDGGRWFERKIDPWVGRKMHMHGDGRAVASRRRALALTCRLRCSLQSR